MLFGRAQVLPIILLPLLVACSSGGDDKEEERQNDAEQSVAVDEPLSEPATDSDQIDAVPVRDSATELAVSEPPDSPPERPTNTEVDEGGAGVEPTEHATERPANTEVDERGAEVEPTERAPERPANTEVDEGGAEVEPTERATERPANTEAPRPETPLSPDEMIRRMDELITRTDAVIRRSLSTLRPPTQDAMTATELRQMYAVEQQRFEANYGQFLEAVNKLLVDDEAP